MPLDDKVVAIPTVQSHCIIINSCYLVAIHEVAMLQVLRNDGLVIITDAVHENGSPKQPRACTADLPVLLIYRCPQRKSPAVKYIQSRSAKTHLFHVRKIGVIRSACNGSYI